MKVKDPVCGMMVDQDSAKAKSMYQGTAYYFCSDECKRMFDADPGRYAMKSTGATA